MKRKVKFWATPYPTRWNNLRPGDYGVDYFDRAAGALEGLFAKPRREREQLASLTADGLFRLNYRIYLPDEPARNPATLGKYLPPLVRAG